ncbi:MAG: hypothetical protein ACFFAO_04630, partial [Candidatus Hermodarchaeota archaeon]
QKDLFKKFSLSLSQKTILIGNIKYHLLPGTIFTGESSYSGAVSLLNDNSLLEIWKSPSDIEIFFSSLIDFTLIDIWGYDYSKIYDHYFDYYAQIRSNLSKIFIKNTNNSPIERVNAVREDYFKIDDQNLKWRVACALRIFQFVETQNYLTKDFFYDKIDESLARINLNWNQFKISLGKVHPLIQFKYALAIMMILASGSFKREPLTPSEEIQPYIFNFWEVCANMVKNFRHTHQPNKKREFMLWNFIFEFPYRSIFKPKFLKYVSSGSLFNNLKEQTPKYDSELNQYIINIKKKFND